MVVKMEILMTVYSVMVKIEICKIIVNAVIHFTLTLVFKIIHVNHVL